MKTLNEAWFACPPDVALTYARDVEQWPDWLPHYRWVRFLRGGPKDGGLVEMAARREFGPLPWPVWWVSEMRIDEDRRRVIYRHVAGITRGMDVQWQIEPSGSGSQVTIDHIWEGGPRFFGPAASIISRAIIGPWFIQVVAEQTLQHMARQIEREVAL